MCSPRVMEKVRTTVSRRKFLGMAAVATLSGAAAPFRGAQARTASVLGTGGVRIQDLTHTVSPDFPVFPGYDQMEITPLSTVEKDGFASKELRLSEHTGTHMDAPSHFDADGESADQLSVELLFAPLAVLDITQRAASDDDAAVTVDDVLLWEEQHGRLPAGAFVAMYSGWESRLSDPEKFINADESGTLHFPGFGPEAARFLLEERDIVGIGVDTLSLDVGASQDFEVHNTVLPAARYGLENLANLGEVIPVGATIIVGGPKHRGATGGPSRVFVLSPDADASALPDTGGANTTGRMYGPL